MAIVLSEAVVAAHVEGFTTGVLVIRSFCRDLRGPGS